MEKNELEKRIDEIVKSVKDVQVENIMPELRAYGIKDPFNYGAWCEHNFELNLRDDYKRKTTFTSDFSIAEFYVPLEGIGAITGTLKRALEGWIGSVEFMCELIMVLNMKCWEHYDRNNMQYSQMYGDLYYAVKDLFLDYYIKDEKAMDYYYDYVD